MPDASFTQTSFLGGEWSPLFQGRTDHPKYKTGMNICLNSYPIEEGSCVRRPGFKFCFPTRKGNPGRRFAFNYDETHPYVLEFTDEHLRISIGSNLVSDGNVSVVDISNATPAVLTVGQPVSWATGDDIFFVLQSGPTDALAAALNRQFTLTVINSTTFSLSDPVTGDSTDGSTLDWSPATMTATACHILDFATSYGNGIWYNNRVMQFDKQAVIFNSLLPPSVVTLTSLDTGTGIFSGFELSLGTFQDGPFFDAVAGQTMTVSGTSGTVTATFSGGIGPNQNALVSGDVGRLIRVFSSPLDWDDATSYALGDNVMFPPQDDNPASLCYMCTTANTGNEPDLSPQDWTLNPEGALWFDAQIQSVLGYNQADITITGLGTSLLYDTEIFTWQMGQFGGQENWPTDGTFHEGRLWCIKNNSVYASVVDTPFLMSPSLPDGTVTDASAINYTLEAGTQDDNNLDWVQSYNNGIVAGSFAGEWTIQASSLSDPITPTSIQAKRVTKYGTANIRPVVTGLSLVFVQKFARKIMEFLTDVFTGKYIAPNLSLTGKHLTTDGIAELGYMEELEPIIWIRTVDGNLRGVTYRRTSSFTTEEAAFIGWHQHSLGGTRTITSLITVPTTDGTLDTVDIISTDGTTYWVEQSTKMFDEDDTLISSFHLDEAVPANAVVDEGTGIKVYGAWHLVGQTVAAWVGGLDCGNYLVGADGSVTIPYESDPGSYLTKAYLQSLNGGSYGSAAALFVSTVSTTPARSPTGATVGEYVNSVAPYSGSSSGAFALPDFGNGRLWTIVSSSTDPAIRVYNIATRASIFVAEVTMLSGTDGSNDMWGGAVGSDGNLYIQIGNSSSPPLFQINPTTAAVTAHFGTQGTGTGPAGLNYSYAMASTIVNGCNYLVCADNNTWNLSVINTSDMRFAAYYNNGASLNAPILTRGNVGATNSGASGTVYIADYYVSAAATSEIHEVLIGTQARNWAVPADAPDYSGSYTYLENEIVTFSGQTYISLAADNKGNSPALAVQGTPTAYWALCLAYASGTTYNNMGYVTYNGIAYASQENSNTGNTPSTSNHWAYLTNPYITTAHRGTVHAASIDATWTTFVLGDMGFDQTDGNLIAAVGSSGHTNNDYIIKIRSSDAAVLWATPISGGGVSGLSTARITQNQVGILTNTGNTYLINTSTGANTISSFSTVGLAVVGGQIIDSETGTLIGQYNYNSATMGAPSPLSGTASSFSGVFAIYEPGTAFIGDTYSSETSGVPAVLGYTYTSQGQLLRPGIPQDAGTANGPPMGKTRRLHMYGALFNNAVTGSVKIGTNFTTNHTVSFTSPGGTPYTTKQLWSGMVNWGPVDAQSDFDNMLCWEVTRPYPLTMVSLGGFLHTQDR